MLRNWSISAKLQLIFVVMLVLAGSVISTFVIHNLRTGAEERFRLYRKDELDKATQRLKGHIDVAFSVIETNRRNAEDKTWLAAQYGPQLRTVLDLAQPLLDRLAARVKAKELSLADAQAQAVEAIRTIRYAGGTGYIWINDMGRPYPKMIMHPTMPEYEGTILDDPRFECALGKKKNLFQAFVEVCAKEGEGFVDYLWPKPTAEGLTEDRAKLSYVRLFRPWNWVLGTGIYVDDAQREAQRKSIENIRAMRWDEGVGYLWINDTGTPYPRMIMHPTLPEYNGKILDDRRFHCAEWGGRKDENLFVAMVRVCQGKTGDGVVLYHWPKPTPTGLTEEQPKISYVRLYEPYNWIVGTGVYIDDIDKAVAIKRSHLEQEIRESILFVVGIIAAIVVIMTFLVSQLTRRIITLPLNRARDMAQAIAAGKLPPRIPITSNDEIGQFEAAFNQMIENSEAIVRQCEMLARGDYSIILAPRSEKDTLTQALIRMTDNLRAFDDRTRHENWIKTALADLAALMRGEQEIHILANNILNFLVRLLDAKIGTMFSVDPNNENILDLVATYAYTQRENFKSEVSLGEGMVGQVALDKRPIVTRVPSDYSPITSSLGSAVPTSLVIYPLIFNEKVVGVVELGAFEEFTKKKLEFLEQGCPAIAIAFALARKREQANTLLEESQRQARLLQEQQEELQQTNEELEERTELLEKQAKELEQQQAELEQINQELEERSRHLEEQRKEMEQNAAERLKEMNVLYSLSILFRNEMTLDDTLENTIQVIPLLCREPEKICVRLIYKKHAYATSGFRTSRYCQTYPLLQNGEEVGQIEICSLVDRSDWERSILGEGKQIVFSVLVEYLCNILQLKEQKAA